jgi:L,D-transpeptidase catalytic domain
MRNKGGSRPLGAMLTNLPFRRRTLASGARSSLCLASSLAALFLASCAAPPDLDHRIVVSVHDQRMAVLEKGKLVATYPISTSKFGLSDRPGSYGTPLGQLVVAEKIGGGAPPGAVFKDRRRTGEVVAPNSPGRDPIVTRILWLRGCQRQNANAFSRDIYIHGTPEERNLGRPMSYGCIRMRSTDIIHLYNVVGCGTQVSIVDIPLETVVPGSSPMQVAAARQLANTVR